jgi:predicted membrane protein
MTEKLPGKNSEQSWLAITIIIVGGIFLLQSFDFLHLGHFIGGWWPIILVAFGFIKLQGSDRPNGAILFIAGLVFLLATLDILNWGSLFRLWPLIILYIGFNMLMRSQGKPGLSFSSVESTDDAFIQASAIFGSVEKVAHSDNFNGANIMSIFGGVDLDLRQVKAVEAGCVINITVLFGGAEIMVPEDWNVIITGTPIFGGLEDKTRGSEKGSTNVTVNCTIAFGGLEIKA